MKPRFTLDENGIDKKLCARIRQKAGNGSINDAARFLLRFWFEQEQCRNLTPNGQILTSGSQDMSIESEIGDKEISDLDDIFSE
jgi:hypothetical protein